MRKLGGRMDNNRYYVKAKQILNNRRTSAIALNEATSDKLSQNPEYKKLEKLRSELFQNLFYANKNNLPTDIIVLDIENINKKIAELAKKMNIRTNNYKCKQCEDTGIINGEYCKCFKVIIEELKRIDTGLEQLPEFTFKDHIEGLNPILDKMYPKLIDYCEEFPKNKIKQIIFNGGVGVGKSCLAAAMANAVSSKGYSVQYIKSNALNDLFLKYHTSPFMERQNILTPLMNCDLLIVDDLGIEPILNNVTLPYLYILLEARDKLHTVVTTNLNKDEIIKRYFERISSRLLDKDKTLIISLTGKDLRLNK